MVEIIVALLSIFIDSFEIYTINYLLKKIKVISSRPVLFWVAKIKKNLNYFSPNGWHLVKLKKKIKNWCRLFFVAIHNIHNITQQNEINIERFSVVDLARNTP